MSIRLRLTLLYSLILALTLVLFGVALYTIQSNYTLNSIKSELVLAGNGFSQTILQADPPKKPDGGGSEPPPKPPDGPVPFRQFSNDPYFQKMPEHEIMRVLDWQGNLAASPFGEGQDALPLSPEGLAAVQSGQVWWQEGQVSGERSLIYNIPVITGGKVVYIAQLARPLTERDNALKSLANILSIASVLTILVAFGAGWLLSGFTLQPIHRITRTAQAIGRERDFTRRVEHRGPPDEIGQLATTFNSMLARLQDAYQQVAHSLEMQRNFVADVSHELRTPLTTLRGNLDLLRREPPIPADEKADILADTTAETDRLIRLVNELLMLARADAGRSLAHEALAIGPVLEEIRRQAIQLAPGREVSLVVPEGLAIVGDRDAFKQVVLILLDNALKHSSGPVQIGAQAAGNRVSLAVQDHGQGIAPETLAHVFDRFYRGGERGNASGFGLGLPIARALVEGMGGTIQVESRVGAGSLVTFVLPAAS